MTCKHCKRLAHRIHLAHEVITKNAEKPRQGKIHHLALSAYILASEAIRLCDERRVDRQRLQGELDRIGEELAKQLGCETNDLLERKGK